jgi:uncharacterized membrane protein SpoIIM required for sporulation
MGSVRALSVSEVKRLCSLYRQVVIDLSQARARDEDPALLQYLNDLAARAHGKVYASRRFRVGLLFGFITSGFARCIRRNWRFVAASTAIFVLTTLASWLAVVRDPELAYSLFNEDVVEYENLRLEKQQGEYRGNFTFSASESPLMAVMIIGNNVKVAILGFGLASLACVPGILLNAYNGRMLGTFSGLVGNAGYLGDFYSLIMTHGVLELSAFCIAWAGGLRIGWAFIAPGRRTRSDAIRLAAGDAFGLLGGAILMLVVAGIIEAFVTPHFGAAVRWSVAAGSAILLSLYIALAGGREKEQPALQ